MGAVRREDVVEVVGAVRRDEVVVVVGAVIKEVVVVDVGAPKKRVVVVVVGDVWVNSWCVLCKAKCSVRVKAADASGHPMGTPLACCTVMCCPLASRQV